MKLHPRPDKAIRAVLDVLERTKRGTAAISGDIEVDYANVRAFALDVYDRADRTDRAAAVNTKATVENLKLRIELFSAAATFLAVLEHFEEHPKRRGTPRVEDVRRRREFAEWRTFDLTQAMQLGRAPSEVKMLTEPAPQPVVVERREVVPQPPQRVVEPTVSAPCQTSTYKPPPVQLPSCPPPPPYAINDYQTMIHPGDDLVSVEAVDESLSDSGPLVTTDGIGVEEISGSMEDLSVEVGDEEKRA
jgi:hypothetical protein